MKEKCQNQTCCGSCKYFDLLDADRHLLKQAINSQGEAVSQGYCRNYLTGGLTLKFLTEETFCKRPEFFVPISETELFELVS